MKRTHEEKIIDTDPVVQAKADAEWLAWAYEKWGESIVEGERLALPEHERELIGPLKRRCWKRDRFFANDRRRKIAVDDVHIHYSAVVVDRTVVNNLLLTARERTTHARKKEWLAFNAAPLAVHCEDGLIHVIPTGSRILFDSRSDFPEVMTCLVIKRDYGITVHLWDRGWVGKLKDEDQVALPFFGRVDRECGRVCHTRLATPFFEVS